MSNPGICPTFPSSPKWIPISRFGSQPVWRCCGRFSRRLLASKLDFCSKIMKLYILGFGISLARLFLFISQNDVSLKQDARARLGSHKIFGLEWDSVMCLFQPVRAAFASLPCVHLSGTKHVCGVPVHPSRLGQAILIQKIKSMSVFHLTCRKR